MGARVPTAGRKAVWNKQRDTMSGVILQPSHWFRISGYEVR
jgi:hypothetical protein